MDFDIQKFISEAKTNTYFDLLTYCEDKLKWLDNIKLSPKSPLKGREHEIFKYRDFVKDYLYFLSSGIKPAAMSDHDFQSTKEITIELVKGKSLNKEVLEAYNR